MRHFFRDTVSRQKQLLSGNTNQDTTPKCFWLTKNCPLFPINRGSVSLNFYLTAANRCAAELKSEKLNAAGIKIGNDAPSIRLTAF
jgi:hypothetical protein